VLFRSLLSANAHELPVQAALTAPASFNLNYRYDGADLDAFTLGTTSYGTSINVGYTRTADGVYYNYTNTSNHSTHPSIIPNGLSITSTFNRSNTTWVALDGLYYAEDTKIGSNNTVGSVANKVYLEFDNQTSKDYYFYFDHSSTATSRQYFVLLNDLYYITYNNNNDFFVLNTALTRIFIPSYSNFKFFSTTNSNSYYFDAWYLQDLGVSDAYDAGYDAGYEVGEDDGYSDGLANNPNLLINAAESLIGMFVNFTFILFTLEMFGVSVLTIVGVLFGIITVVWILKTIRGG
jgi:hypothetical protein